MKPRRILSTKILVVAAVSAGCGQSKAPDASATTAASEAQRPPAPGVTQAGAASASSEALMAEQIRLFQLQGELSALSVQEAMAQSQKFRPLCDEKGYPLVGNMARKGGPDVAGKTATASEFCEALRARKP